MTSKKIVLVTGVFDVLHLEHKQFLINAKTYGSILIVGIESDTRVRQLKGENRPINSQKVRKKNLLKWKIADEVFVLPEKFSTPQDHETLIKKIKPAVLAVSSHTPNLDKKRAILQKYGARVIVVHKHNSKISSTKIIEKKKG